MYQRGVLDLGNPRRQLMLKWDKEKHREEVVVERGGTLLEDMMMDAFRAERQNQKQT